MIYILFIIQNQRPAIDENVSHIQQYDYAFDIRLWNVTGGVDGLVCKSVNSSSEDMLCK